MSRPDSRGQPRKPSARPPYALHQAFGAPSELGGFLIDDETILYAVGRHVVTRGLESRAMTFVHESPANVTQLTAMTMSSDRRHVAVCECWQPSPKAAPQPRVRVVAVAGKRTVATLNAAVEGSYEACAFSEDDKYVLAHTGAPDHVVVVWRWADERPVGLMRSKTPIGRVRFNPGASTLLSLNAPMRICRLSEKGHFKEIDVGSFKRHGKSAVDHVWLSKNQMVLATQEGHVLVFNDGSLQQTLPGLGFVPRCVCAFASAEGVGFLAGGGEGQLVVFRGGEARKGAGEEAQADEAAEGGGHAAGGGGAQQKAQLEFAAVATAQGAAGQGAVRQLHPSPDGAVVLAWCAELCCVPLKELLVQSDGEAAARWADGGEGEGGVDSAHAHTFGVAVSGAHAGAVLGLACAVSKPLLVSCGVDCTVRVWDYRSWSCQLVSSQPEGPQGVALHPDGMQLLLSFKERVRAYHIGISELIPWREHEIPAAREARTPTHCNPSPLAAALHILLACEPPGELLGAWPLLRRRLRPPHPPLRRLLPRAARAAPGTQLAGHLPALGHVRRLCRGGRRGGRAGGLGAALAAEGAGAAPQVRRRLLRPRRRRGGAAAQPHGAKAAHAVGPRHHGAQLGGC